MIWKLLKANIFSVRIHAIKEQFHVSLNSTQSQVNIFQGNHGHGLNGRHKWNNQITGDCVTRSIKIRWKSRPWIFLF